MSVAEGMVKCGARIHIVSREQESAVSHILTILGDYVILLRGIRVIIMYRPFRSTIPIGGKND